MLLRYKLKSCTDKAKKYITEINLKHLFKHSQSSLQELSNHDLNL